ncbi:glycosyltransferase [Nocardia yunnanensis]|uniref:Glycosyltransferase n=1 Tax=Nocardia yunnanensis TaxID=2382165 RepID=A0A386ZF28_9NOCA|nr:nucleotide disphospho-sugar-binding domain-containing protein [Nocardia yunnanensis]AYF76482.1 glycosyltransferase [Nocardia yunnanensis]
MRILISTTPMEGVFAPVVPVATALVAQGHDVLVATAAQLAGRVRACGLPVVIAGPDAPQAAAKAVTLPEFQAGTQPWRIGAVMFGKVMAPAKLDDLRVVAERFEPDLVLHAPVDLAAPLLAAMLDVPSVTYGTGLLLEPELLGAMAEWVAPLWHSAGLEPDEHAGLYRHGYLDPVPESLQPDRGPAADVARAVRPAVPGGPGDRLPEWASGLGDRPVVYVSLGTVPIFNQPTAFAPLLAGLAELDVDVAVTVGTDVDPAALGSQPSNVHVSQWLSLAALLPRCDAVLCHGGAGTTLAALAHGLPLVLSPRGADQFPTAAAVRAVGAAQVLAPDEVTSSAVRAAVTAVLTDVGYRDAAHRVRSNIAAVPDAADVAAALGRDYAPRARHRR